MSNFKKILLLGPPASGKGTQASRLSKLFNLPILGTGNLLRQAVSEKSPLGIKADDYISKGLYVPDSLIQELVSEWAGKNSQGWIFDGFPRTISQAQFMLDQPTIGKPDLVIGLNVTKESLEGRVNSRRLCTKCDLVTSTFVHDQESCPDPGCEGVLYARNDDAIESFLVRYAQYTELTLPLFDYFEKENILSCVDGELSPDKVWEQINSIVN